MHIERIRTVNPEIMAALARLVPQLTKNHPPPGEHELAAMLGSDLNVLLVARVPDSAGVIVAAGSLGTYQVPTGVRAVIEDVVVDSAARGRGIGEAIMRRLLEFAREMGAPGVTLTSNPSRKAANRLYLGMGFQRRETNCYYYAFGR